MTQPTTLTKSQSDKDPYKLKLLGLAATAGILRKWQKPGFGSVSNAGNPDRQTAGARTGMELLLNG